MALGIAAFLVLSWLLSRFGIAAGLWRGIAGQRLLTAAVSVLLLFATLLTTMLSRDQKVRQLHDYVLANISSPTNLVANGELDAASVGTATVITGWTPLTGTIAPINVGDNGLRLESGAVLASNIIRVQPGATYRFSFVVPPSETGTATVQVRLLWLNDTLEVRGGDCCWNDSVPRRIDYANIRPPFEYVDGQYAAPEDATHLRVELRSLGADSLQVVKAMVWTDGAYVEAHPNGTRGAIAFSFDWESAMGGAIHSKGMTEHDPVAAAEHGTGMRQGADWLNDLFVTNDISATFYSTGYNLLDGNTERREFSGNPRYEWASREYGWETDYWQENAWYGDDPYGTYASDPAWYFGDQARKLLAAGYEIAPHTFGHLYVRGSNPDEMRVDTEEWLKAASDIGVPPPSTFAFPWRSSNSLRADMYEMLYDKGIRAVTRVYPLDMVDQYVVGAVKAYPKMLVMPDFRLEETASSIMDEESGGATIGSAQALHVIEETLVRRGTTSFWTHPEVLADDAAFAPVRSSWQRVVEAATLERDRGRLWIDTVASIIDYEIGIKGVTTEIQQSFMGLGGWTLVINNNSGRELEGVTLTLPGHVSNASQGDVSLRTVHIVPPAGTVAVSSPGSPLFPSRQLVIEHLKPGTTTIQVDWAPGQEPSR